MFIEENQTEVKQSRWSSKLMWSAIIGQVVVIADIVGLWQVIGVDRSVFTTVITAVLQILVIVGVVNDPTNKKGW